MLIDPAMPIASESSQRSDTPDLRTSIFMRLAEAAERLAGTVDESLTPNLKVLPFVQEETGRALKVADEGVYNSPELLRCRLMQSCFETQATDNDRLLLVHRMYHLETKEEWLTTTNATELLRLLDPVLKPANAATSLRLMAERALPQVEVIQAPHGHREKSFRLTAAGLLWVKCLLAGLVYARPPHP